MCDFFWLTYLLGGRPWSCRLCRWVREAQLTGLGIPTFPWWFWKDQGSSSPKRPEELQVLDFFKGKFGPLTTDMHRIQTLLGDFETRKGRLSDLFLLPVSRVSFLDTQNPKEWNFCWLVVLGGSGVLAFPTDTLATLVPCGKGLTFICWIVPVTAWCCV